MNYNNFLNSKFLKHDSKGISVNETDLNPILFDWQKKITKWSLLNGKSAIFAGCGLGKTIMQLEWSKMIHEKTGSDILILAPIAVSLQTIEEGRKKLNIKVTNCRSSSQVKRGINITNYEMLDHFKTENFGGIVLDESSILKSYMGKMRNELIDRFINTDYKLACTATPAPNDYTEMGNHSEFLNVLSRQEMLSRFFINDTSDTQKWRLKGHATKSYWEWVSSWAVCMERPSDIGYDDDSFILPELNIHEIIVDVKNSKFVKRGLIHRDISLSATDLHGEMRLTSMERAAKAAELVNNSDDIWIVWCNSNYEADDIKKLIPEAKEIRGSDNYKTKEKLLYEFSNGNIRVLITKPSIAGFGMNWQHCHKEIFVGLSYSFEQQYQAIRRCWRFGQKEPVDVFIIMADTEVGVYNVVKEKTVNHQKMIDQMMGEIKYMSQISLNKNMNTDYKQNFHSGGEWELINGDCIEEIKNVQSDYVDFSIFSPPFSQLFVYSDSIRDMGNCKNDEEFFQHFKFLIPEILRITKPGRLCAVHCSVLPLFKHQVGYIGLKDFRGDIIKLFQEHNWIFHSEVCIWKDPVIEMQRTKALGLLHKQIKKDSSMCRQGIPDYLVVFRKHGDNAFPVTHTEQNFSVDKWQKWASPVWFDIKQTNTLNTKVAKESKDEKHICPLQLEVIERSIELWTNPGDLVFSPFAGIGSEGYEAVRLGRRFLGIELKEQYFKVAIDNLTKVEKLKKQANFGLLGI